MSECYDGKLCEEKHKTLNDTVDEHEIWLKKHDEEIGVLTLGYGMTEDEIKGLSSVTEEQASSMLEDWLNKKYASVLKTDLSNKGITLTQNQFDALTSMAYNEATFQTVTELQKNWERPTDGVLRMETWSIFLNN